jgi:hypothetical protein
MPVENIKQCSALLRIRVELLTERSVNRYLPGFHRFSGFT